MLGLSNPTHILLVLLVALVVFGAKRLPEAGRALGTGMREFKDSLTTSTATSAHQPPEADSAS